MVYGAWDYGATDLDKLSGDLSEDVIRDPNPWGGESIPVALDASADMRSAWVALRDNANKRPSSSRCSKTVRDWRCGTNASNTA